MEGLKDEFGRDKQVIGALRNDIQRDGASHL